MTKEQYEETLIELEKFKRGEESKCRVLKPLTEEQIKAYQEKERRKNPFRRFLSLIGIAF